MTVPTKPPDETPFTEDETIDGSPRPPRASALPTAATAAASRPDAEATPVARDQRFRLGAVIGAGGMAVVHEALDTELERTVAVKVMRRELERHPEAATRFFAEARILAGLDHPGTVPVFAAGRLSDGQPYYAMKKVRGRTLRALLEERSPAELGSPHVLLHLVDLFERVCQTVAAAHAEAIIHRDLKPENVMVDEVGGVYVMDWGLAKRRQPAAAGDSGTVDAGTTMIGAIIGTPSYMSPEQAAGYAAISDRSSDVFSLGAILYEILTGARPFAGDDPLATLEGVLHHDPEPPVKRNRQAGRALSAVCMKALAKDPAKRYPSARELAADIRAFREHLPVSAASHRVGDRVVRWARRHPVPAAVAATLAFALVVATVGLGLQASAENALVARAYAAIEADMARIGDLDRAIDRADARLADAAADDPQRAAVAAERRRLAAERDVARQHVTSVALAITGFTVFSPDATARRLVLDNHRADIARAIEEGRLEWAEAAIDRTLRGAAGGNPLGLTDDDHAWLEARRQEIARRHTAQ